MAITKNFANKILDTLTARNTAYSVNNLYLGLSKTTPNTDGSNVTEPSENGYARVLIGKNQQSATWKMNEAENGATVNGEQIAFPKATGAWGSCTYACLFDAETDGNLLWFGALTTAISPVSGEVAVVEASNISISIS